MREIKFRVFCQFRKQMITVGVDSNASFNHDGTISTHGVLGGNPLMQYTSLKDKNGIDIYEGDILQFTDAENRATENGDDWEDIISRGNVYWNEDELRWDLTGRLCVELDDAFRYDPLIIGNIYQTPNLT